MAKIVCNVHVELEHLMDFLAGTKRELKDVLILQDTSGIIAAVGITLVRIDLLQNN